VAGIGMSALAQALLASGWAVTGSDRLADAGTETEVLETLRGAGVRLCPQDGSGITDATDAVVVSTAIERGNPDLVAAERRGIPVRHRAEMLAALLEGRETIAVTGTSGKTTVTGMVGWILERLGADPTVVNGGVVLNWAGPGRLGNVRVGRSNRWVIEADESDRSLLRFRPDWALITNASADHFTLSEVHALFEQFRAQVRREVLIGWDPAMPWHDLEAELAADGVRFDYRGVAFHVPLLGRHNAENALQAAVLAERMGYDREAVGMALRSFAGIHRRLERVGIAGGVTVVDDYAHNPAKIAAAWRAVAPFHRRVIAVWQPHGFAPLAHMLEDLVVAIRAVAGPDDILFVLPVYYAGGTASRAVSAADLVARLTAERVAAARVETADALVARVTAAARAGDAVLSMGARDPGLPALARRLAAALGA
jgi:UDP-N-acetylmuramate--alanine ligase